MKKNEFPSKLSLQLGNDAETGRIVEVDLARLSHLLIAGKVGVYDYVSMLCRELLEPPNTSKHLRLHLIDPEKSVLNSINVSNELIDLAPFNQLLDEVRKDIELRYKLLREEGARDILTFNRKKEIEGDDEGKLYRRVVVITELALCMEPDMDIEVKLARIAGIGRAVGVHLIVATSYPIPLVLPGAIKILFGARVALKVKTTLDSDQILDVGGAELLTHNECLYQAPGEYHPVKLEK